MIKSIVVVVVKFPNEITLKQTGPNSFQQTVYLNNLSEGIITPSYRRTQTTANWETQKKKIGLSVKEDMVTLVKLDLSLTSEKTADIYSGTLKYSVAAPEPYLEKPIEIVQESIGPTYYKSQYEEVYSSVIKTVEQLDWELKDSNRASGKVETLLGRFPGSPLVFAIIIHPSGDGQIQVDVSSDSGWQRSGSLNTGISIENISEFYQNLDRIMGV